MADGRLADPDRSLETDPRSDPRMVAALTKFGIGGNMPLVPITIDAPLDERLGYADMCEAGIGAVLDAFAPGVPDADGVTTTTTTITGEDGNDITLYISRPETASPLPAVVHLHGGGMAIASAADAMYSRVREFLAASGLVVVGVEFRNSGGKLGPHAFPAGLNDCAAGVRWVAAHRAELGVSHLIVSGESGGGNLTLTVGHKAKREGWLHEIAGLYAQCPYISNKWHEVPDDFPSLRECDGYFVSLQQAEMLASIYDPSGEHVNDPTCFAGYATAEDLSGLPPHVISVNELDPMRDEGLDYYRRLVRAGVPAVGRVVAGTCHGGDLLFPGVMPDVFAASMRDLSGFAKSLG
ncbi:alpha/beta hydrolase fold domain-containing protein [Candidatus Mycobacterium wuenschmannii]|uniref:Alpha/beta hydrolase fold domain-containing protein n=1 Tax=Candidatus Mycobacterium wuenschmannii TaxID=3027808 RepID=A0ABY8VVP3_9MYCO|nr:alpha/beta hydrolase fold domain-containing protein [Candidatus Mycobacterium wuenschmannii]WIM87131.1 alpha/beta hydrolase fold domain-containing protein [Candidatus Mycobacterium wuenschmannii]